MANEKIIVKGAKEHNLKNIDVEIPKNSLTVITGISGSGKSSLAFDTIYAEGQRRYVESLSNYARQFLGVMEKPEVDYIQGLSPAISIDQKSASRNPRSTVGTVTEIYDYLRLLFSRIGHPHCPECGAKISKQTTNEIVEQIISKYSTPTKILIFAPVVRQKKGEHKYTLIGAKRSKFTTVRLDGVVMDLDEALELTIDRTKEHTIEILIDQYEIFSKASSDCLDKLYKGIQKALELAAGMVTMLESEGEKEYRFSQLFTCSKCGLMMPEITPRSFSFNNPEGACPVCQGLGIRQVVDPNLVIPNTRLTLAEGAIRPWTRLTSQSNWYQKVLVRLANKYEFSLDTEIAELPVRILKVILYGEKVENEAVDLFEGVIPNLERRYRETDSDYVRSEVEKYMVEKTCASCQGHRLRKEVLSIKVAEKNIVQITALNIEEAKKMFASINDKLSDSEKKIASQLIKEIQVRLGFLMEVGLPYLTLERNASTLSGGEAQRIRLATQLGSSLTGILYVLDEPSIGLHQRDQEKLLKTLLKLRDMGNTVIVVEHDESTIREADWLIDVGPGAGEYGGEIVSQGTPLAVSHDPNSVTGKYLSGKKTIPVPSKRRIGSGAQLSIKGADEFNLKNIDIAIPLNQLVCVTGVSGSGKSTLIFDILAKSLARQFYRAKAVPGKYKSITGVENIDKVIIIDQSPIGRTPRSNPATYVSLFTDIRDLFTNTEEAKLRGYNAGQFSFNVRGGRCENCRGDGVIKIEMNFLPDVYVACEECKGKRYNKETLEIKYKGKTIADVLDMTVEEARSFFSDIPQLVQKLDVLIAVGLGYLHLGQPATNLSGGEAQRIKLATELSRSSTGNTLYILDEPTSGLHFEDINKLLGVLNKLVDKGNSVVVIEHNLDVVKSSDWVIDLGPEGGDQGGQIIAQGTPEEVAKVSASYTGKYLKPLLSAAKEKSEKAKATA